MGIAYVDKLLEERAALTGIMTSLKDKAADGGHDLAEEERSEIARLQERCVQIDALLTEHQAQHDSARAFAELQSRIEAGREESPRRSERREPSRLESTSPGRAFVESEQFRSYPGRGQGGAFQIADYPLSLETRALITTANLAIPHVILAPREQVTPVSPLLEIVDTQRVSGGVAEWVEVGPDPLALVVAEGAAKPEAAITFTPKTAALDTIAHWVQITRQALSDAAYVQSLIETKLRRGVLRAIEAEIAAALAAATLPTATVPAGPTATLLQAVRVGVGTVQAAGYNPNAVVLNPADWADMDTSVMGSTLGGPVVGQSFWGLRAVAAASQPAGTATVGDFQSGVSWLDRGVTDVFLTDSHASFFISNILVILAEARGKAVVPEPNALCECSVAAA